MDKDLKKILTKLFERYTFKLTAEGTIKSVYYIVKDCALIKVENTGDNFDAYLAYVLYQAQTLRADGLIYIFENVVFLGDGNDNVIQSMKAGHIRVEEHPDSSPYLILTYLAATGEREALVGKIEKDPSGKKFIVEQEWAEEISFQEQPGSK